MTATNGRPVRVGSLPRSLFETIRRAYAEFLKIPTLVILGFLVLGVITFVLDGSRAAYGGASESGWRGLFSDAQGSRDFLGVIAGSIITVTSITLSLLLVAVQQGAAALSSIVFDQFLRRRTNQLYFGFFIGLALYSLIVLASVNPTHQPVYGVAVAGVLTVAALFMLILLIYTTINQMRPVVIIKTIHDHTLHARERQLGLLSSTRRARRLEEAPGIPIQADRSGFMVRLNADAITKAIGGADIEVTILPSIGDYIAVGEPVAAVTAGPEHDLSSLKRVVREALAFEAQRDLDTDPAFGIEQLATIGWTSISTAKSNPDPGLLAIWNLRDLLARWLEVDAAFGAAVEGATPFPGPVVYTDNVPEQLMRAFESIAVVASESMQHQSAAEVYRTFARLFHRFPPPLRQRSEDLLLRSLSGLGDHIMTANLEASLADLIDALTDAEQTRSAGVIEAARGQLEQSIGKLNSRSTRVDISPV